MNPARTAAVLLVLQAAAAGPEPQYLRYRRLVALPPLGPAVSRAAHACATLDAAVFEHSIHNLADMRLLQNGREIPYVTTISQTSPRPPEPAAVLDPVLRGNVLRFDLRMPTGPDGRVLPYTALNLQLQATDFVATAHISGLRPPDNRPIPLPPATLFDLSSQGLARSTTISLPETTYPLLEMELSFRTPQGTAIAPPGLKLLGVEVPPAREAQTLYTLSAETSTFTERGPETIASLRLPAHVPVERVTFTPAPGERGPFARNVRIGLDTFRSGTDRGFNPAEEIPGVVSRTSLPARAGLPALEQDEMSVPATLGANLREPAAVDFAIENGSARPLHWKSIALEMRQRQICFAVPASTAPLILYYGDFALPAPEYTQFTQEYRADVPALTARLGPEEPNPIFLTRPVPRGFLAGRHPELLWLLAADLAGGVIFLAVELFRSRRRRPEA